MRDDAVERLFSLFTSSDRAVAMAGDLAEERERRGWIWFWLHVVRVTFALWRSAVTEAPLPVLALMLAGCALFTAPAFAGACGGLSVSPLDGFGRGLDCAVVLLVGWRALRRRLAGRRRAAARHGRVRHPCHRRCGPVAGLWRDDRAAGVQPRGSNVLHHRAGNHGRTVGRWRTRSPPDDRHRRSLRRRDRDRCHRALRDDVRPRRRRHNRTSGETHRRTRQRSSPSRTMCSWRCSTGVAPARRSFSWRGSEHTAHHYDDFAPALTARYRVVGVTRRGHRGSSAAPGGYGFDRLAEDVLRVIDAVGVNNPVVIGHSFAGEEMHVLGARHSAKIRGLVYVDAAFDRGDDADNEAYYAVAKTVPAAPSPQPGDLASFTALRAYLEKYGGAGPEALPADSVPHES